MSEAHVEDRSSAIQTPQQLIIAVLLAFLVPIAIIAMVVQIVTGGISVESHAMSDSAVAQRLKPVGEVALATAAPATAARSGEEVVRTICQACHGAGLVGAPKIGDVGAWKARIAQGEKTLTAHAINGIRTMPPRGGAADLSDAELEQAVVWMANHSGANFAQPAARQNQPTAAAQSDGSKVYQTVCAACHGSGLVGAPKLGDRAAWKPRLAQGLATLHEHAVKGIRGMPPKGGNPSLADGDVSAAVDYMVSQSK